MKIGIISDDKIVMQGEEKKSEGTVLAVAGRSKARQLNSRRKRNKKEIS